MPPKILSPSFNKLSFGLVSAAGGTLLLDPGVLSATVIIAYSSRKLRTLYAGSAMLVTTSAGGNATQNIGFTGTDLDTASLHSFIGANTGYLTTWYDQSTNANDGTGDATLTKQLPVIVSGTDQTLNGKIAPTGIAANSTSLVVPGSATQPFTICIVHKCTDISNDPTLWDHSGDRVNLVIELALTRYLGGAGSTIATSSLIADTNAHAVFFIYNGTSSHIVIDGTNRETSNDAGTANFAGSLLGGNTIFNPHAGPLAEFIIFNGALSAPDQATLLASWQTYWGTP